MAASGLSCGGLVLSRVQLSVTPWTAAHQVPRCPRDFPGKILERVDISFFRLLKRLIVIKVNLLQNFVMGLTDVLIHGMLMSQV